MQLKTCSEFVADFPYDGIEDDEDFIEHPGRGVTEAIAEMLRACGFEVSAPEHQFEMGWDFNVATERKRVWILISAFYGLDAGCECILQTEGYGGLFDRRRTLDVHAEVLTRLNTAMASDGRFSKVRWLLQNEVQNDVPGSPTPVSE